MASSYSILALLLVSIHLPLAASAQEKISECFPLKQPRDLPFVVTDEKFSAFIFDLVSTAVDGNDVRQLQAFKRLFEKDRRNIKSSFHGYHALAGGWKVLDNRIKHLEAKVLCGKDFDDCESEEFEFPELSETES